TLLGGGSVSGNRNVAGRELVVEGRPLDGGGAVVLAQAAGLSATTARDLRRAEIVALIAGLAGGAFAGVLLARRLARPLRRLADGVVEPAAVPATGSTLVAEAERLDRLVSDLLDLARLGAQDFRIELRDADLVGLVGAAAEVWRQRCATEEVSFGVELPPPAS